MSTIAEFISGTVNESLKKLLQPVGLIPAAIFVLLNLAFVYPAARDDGVPLAKAFADLDAPTQAAVVGLFTLALGYFLLSASSTILDILGGQLIRGSVVHALLVWWQRRRRNALSKVVPPNPWYVSKRFYLPREGEERDPLPSALGNVLVATQGTVERRYGADMAVLWSHFVATPELKELPARAVVDDERAARDTLANTAFVLWLFALEGLVFFTFRNEPEQALLSLIGLPTGYVVYQFAVAKAHAWGSAVETLFDLHRDKLHAALKLARYQNLSSERKVWEKASQFLVNAAEDPPGDDVFDEAHTPSVTAIPSGDLVIPKPVSAVLDGSRADGDSVWLRWIEYVVLVAKKSDAAGATTVEVLVDDPRVTRIEPPGPTDGSRRSRVVPGAGRNEQLLWTLEWLASGAAVSLRYALPLYRLRGEVDEGEAPHLGVELLRGVGFALDVPRGIKRLRLTSYGGDRRPELRVTNTLVRPTSSDGRSYVWSGVTGSVWLVLPDHARA